MNALSLAPRLIAREWRAGELRVLVIALVLSVAAVTSVAFFTDRVGRVLERQAGELLGADLRIASSTPPRAELRQAAERLGLKLADTVTFPSMVQAGDNMHLADIRAVSASYPLRGRVRTAAQPGGAESRMPTGAPAPGTVWAEAALLDALGLKVGDRLGVGETELRVARVLTYEPDRGGELFSIAPHLLMDLSDLPATGLVQPGSRVRYRLLLAGGAEEIAAYRALIAPRLKPNENLEGLQDARPELRAALTRAQQFLGLAALAGVLLAGVAVAMAARRFSARQMDAAAMMRCLGAAQRFIWTLYALQLALISLVAGAAGAILGFVAQGALAALLADLVPEHLPPPSAAPWLLGIATSLLMLLGFALPPLLRLKDTPTLRVLRRELSAPPASALATYGAGLAAFAGLLLWQARDLKLGGYALAGTAGTLLALTALALAALYGLGRVRARVGATWGFGIAQLARRAGSSAAQVAALGLGIMAMLLLSLVRADLMESWRASLPRDANNRFLINIQPEQVEALRAFFRDSRFPTPQFFPPEFYPMVRGRLTAINGRPVSAASFEGEHAKRLVDRDFNLSWAAQLAPDNRVVAGTWWRTSDSGQHWLSVEKDIADTLGIRLGDRLTYFIAGSEVTGTVRNLREVDWDSFRVNFFVVAAPSALEDFPKTYITSFYLPPQRAGVLSALVKQFPNVTVIDVEAIMAQVRALIDRLTRALEYVFAFTLAAGIVVLYAAIQASHDERMQESALLRTLGASRRQLVARWLAELATLGLLSGLVAALAASILAYALAEHVLHLPYHPSPWLYLWGPMAGVLGASIAGFLGMHAVLRRPPLETLRAL